MDVEFAAMTLTLGSFGCFAWFRYQKERDRTKNLSALNMRLTMENYNLNMRLSKVIPIKRPNKKGIVGFDVETGALIKKGNI